MSNRHIQTEVTLSYGIPPDIRLYDVADETTISKVINDVEHEHIRQLVAEITGCTFGPEHMDALQQLGIRLLASFKKQQDSKDRDDEFKQYLNGREVLANKLLNAMNDGKVYFRWADNEDKVWKELTAYSLLVNTFDGAEFKFETVISHEDIIKGKVL